MAEKLVYCKACGQQIAKSAKSCPHCGAKHKKGHPVLGTIILVFGIIIFANAIGGTSSSNQPKVIGQNETTVATQPAKTKFSVGEKVELNNVVATLVSVTESKGSSFNTPTAGNVFLLAEFEIENNTNSDMAVSSMMSFKAYVDGYSTNLSLSALIEKSGNQLDGSISAGKKMRGSVGYEVPADWKEFEIEFTPNVWTGRDIIFVATK